MVVARARKANKRGRGTTQPNRLTWFDRPPDQVPVQSSASSVGALPARLVHGRDDLGEALLGGDAYFRMREQVEFARADRTEHTRRHVGRVEPGLNAFGNVRGYLASPASRLRRPPRSIAFRAVALTLIDAGAHPSGTEHGHADAERF